MKAPSSTVESPTLGKVGKIAAFIAAAALAISAGCSSNVGCDFPTWECESPTSGNRFTPIKAHADTTSADAMRTIGQDAE